jgi:hypothetical protein
VSSLGDDGLTSASRCEAPPLPAALVEAAIRDVARRIAEAPYRRLDWYRWGCGAHGGYAAHYHVPTIQVEHDRLYPMCGRAVFMAGT